MTNPLDWIRETWMCNRLGLNRDELRELRNTLLKEGEDYTVLKNRMMISPAGEKKLREHLKVPPASPRAAGALQTSGGSSAPPDLKNAAPGKSPEGIEPLLVWRANLPNHRIVEAYRPGENPADRRNILRVKVRDATRFSRYDNTGLPMKIPAVHLQADLYEHVGPQPRRKGRY